MKLSFSSRYLRSAQFWRQAAGRQLQVSSTAPNTNTATAGRKRNFHFASNDYAKCFRGLPTPDMNVLRESAKTYLKSFDPQSWYNDPVSIITVANSHFILFFNYISSIFLTSSIFLFSTVLNVW